MNCPSCGFACREGAKFCDECGIPLQSRCPSCGFENRPGAKFCSECATPLTVQTVVLQTSDSKPRTLDSRRSEAERRQLTVMFCDVVGSTALSEQLDPEELREVMQAYQHACVEVVTRFEGHVAKYLGDGVLVYFGYPTAHEDDAARAVRAGLGIVEAMQALLLPPHVRLPHPLQVRLGIHTGLVVAGEMGSGEYREQLAVVGETPNLAARLQEKALPNSVVISPATQRLVAGLFECQDMGPQTLKGISTPLPMYRVVRENEAQSRFEVAVTTGLTPLVGREEEVGLLWQRWEWVKKGAGQVVLLSGEPGIGKSRLVQVLKERVASEAATRLECRCSPYYQNSALYPVIDLLQRVLQFQRNDTPEEKLRKLEGALEPYGFALPEVVPLWAVLLSLPLPERYLPLTLTPQKQKEKTQQAVVTWLLAKAERQSLLSAWEDLHWADPSTLELLGLLIDQAPTARIYLLLTFRPEFSPPWASRSHLTPLTLSRLPRTQAEEMVEKITGGKALPAEVLQQVVSKTDGVPLFVEELTKTVVESGLVRATNGHYELAGPLPPLAIPTTLQDSLMARLDRLGTAKAVAQLGATLGREFPYEVLQTVSPVDEASLQQALAKLVEAEVLYQRGLPPQARYLFKHALIQDAAYQSLLKSKRQQYHQQIAQVLEERFPETKETQPELLAYHYTEARLAEQAIPYWQRAGQTAIERSANVEAVSHLTKGLELLKTQPDTPKRAQQELTLQITLGASLVATKGYAAPEVGTSYTQARELCQQIGEVPQLFPVMWGLCAFYAVRAEHETARELGESLLRLGQSVADPALQVMARLALGGTLLWLGEFPAAREHLEQGIALYNPQQHHSLAFLHGYDPGLACHSYAALALWGLGYPDQALKRVHEALTLAHELPHPFSLAHTLAWAAVLRQHRREEQAAQEQAEATMTLSTQQEFPLWLAMGTVLRGWALTEQGMGEQGLAQVRQGQNAWRATGAGWGVSYYPALLAEACGKAGQAEAGLHVLAETFPPQLTPEEHWWEAEKYRLKGELTLQQFQGSGPRFQVSDPQAEAEECFQKAIEIARRQSAKSLELRAVMSLSRLWWQQGKKAEARQMLAEIYGWFTEGLDTKDLQEAKALLAQLT